MRQKLTATLLSLSLLLTLSLISCTPSDGAPAGMKVAADGENGYVLFVPASWQVVPHLGGLYAYVSEINTTGIVFTYSDLPSDGSAPATAAAAYAREKDAMAATLANFTELSTDENVLFGDRPAFLVIYTYTLQENTLRAASYYTLVGDRLYLLTYTEVSQGESFTDVEKQAADVVATAQFTDHRAGGVGIPAFADDGTPDGMKRASNPAYTGYKLFVPDSYVIHSATDTTLVSVSATDATSVHAYITVPNVATLDEFVQDYKEEKLPILYRDLVFSDGGSTATVAGVPWTRLVYTGTYGGTAYKVEQYFLKSEYYVFSLTYTARAERFDTHRADFQAILDAFSFGE